MSQSIKDSAEGVLATIILNLNSNSPKKTSVIFNLYDKLILYIW